MPDPIIKKPFEHFNVVTYTGNSSTQSINVGFQPDLVWIKDRVVANDHRILDSLRGATKFLSSSLTNAEATDASGLTAFTSTGFNLGADSSYNFSGRSYVAWCWKANGAGSSNTSGSITSTVSANTSAGFSVVTYTGNGSSPATIGHGLGVAPKMIICKSRSAGSTTWLVYSSSANSGVGQNGYLQLNATAAFASDVNAWNNTAPTSSVFTVGSYSNTNTATYVAYCFAEVAGYSKFGSYTGNGSTDGPFIYTGFKPKYFMVKRTDGGTNNWAIFDSARNPANAVGKELEANLSDAEYNGDTSNPNDFLSNGFKIRHTGTAMNLSGGTYIYMAFAENPFKYSLAR